MRVKYDSAQDLTLVLSTEERRLLVERTTRDYYDFLLNGRSKELGAYVFLGHSLDGNGVLAEGMDIGDGFGKIVIPSPDLPHDPWLVNLFDRGVRFLKNGWIYGVRYTGGNKLFILEE